MPDEFHKFFTPDYLTQGNKRQRESYCVITQLQIFELLKNYTPFLAGTIPINIDVPDSDLDILCCACNFTELDNVVTANFSALHAFKSEICDNYYIANFEYDNYKIEIYAETTPVQLQRAYRHMIIEHRIIEALGENFRQAIVNLKLNGMKTEPAFGKLLGLNNPYNDLLDLYEYSNDELQTHLANIIKNS